MEIKDRDGISYIPSTYGVQYVQYRKSTYHWNRRKIVQHSVVVGFNREAELYMRFEKKADAMKVYEKLRKRIKEEII